MLARFFIACLLVFSPGIFAANLTEAELRKKLTDNLSEIKITQVDWLQELNLFRVITDDFDELYVTGDGEHFILGEQFSFNTKGKIRNISRRNREKRQFAEIKNFQTNQTIIFPAEGKTKAWVLVFTDIDCGYCRKFHREIEEITKLGIEVRYAAFPRTGPNTDSFAKAENVWCAKDQQQAMTFAKQGKRVTSKPCQNSVADQYEFGRRVGVTGTPTIFLSNGKVVPGYIPSIKLAAELGV